MIDFKELLTIVMLDPKALLTIVVIYFVVVSSIVWFLNRTIERMLK